MLKTKGMAPHELLELHEILASEAAAAQKLEVCLAATTDMDLRNFMHDAIAARQRRVSKIERMIGNVTTSGEALQ